ncbi:ABC transporter ATP-binding protein [Chelatococcus asaccharovorans]|uniref:Peptide/nickel transport system ATP-binding protein n=1 Tax=Chelatococcus asaccharovorans TaxID=28210 RepID=A0A2V3U3P0_9HYPH|nr:ABC transporter ATP-binding protein [Chelatococcus asaccharovorans]MBS7703046.1 ABC transporter ATP-binding protein [Chelatococcus asaccharovorans]PXW57345.1 peptide/nickel transport system ATP-binding protein [Chelatococcus asaccharovorans]
MALVEIENLTVTFGGAPAVRNVNLAVGEGEAIGVIGESGCGKSVTWLAALGLLPGHVAIDGQVRLAGEDIRGAPPKVLDRIRGRRIAMIFQDPASALNPTKKVGRQVTEVLKLHRGMGGDAAWAEAKRLFDQVGIPDPAERLKAYPHQLSGGQNQRVMIAMALAGQPDVLVADEPTTALDVTIQAQILDLLKVIRRDTGMALVLISHDLGVVAEVCSRAYVMYAGTVVEEGTVASLFSAPSHPYTRGLLAALPSLGGPVQRLRSIPGSVPHPNEVGSGCPFAPRCDEGISFCQRASPPLRQLSVEFRHAVACLRRHSIAIGDMVEVAA